MRRHFDTRIWQGHGAGLLDTATTLAWRSRVYFTFLFKLGSLSLPAPVGSSFDTLSYRHTLAGCRARYTPSRRNRHGPRPTAECQNAAGHFGHDNTAYTPLSRDIITY